MAKLCVREVPAGTPDSELPPRSPQWPPCPIQSLRELRPLPSAGLLPASHYLISLCNHPCTIAQEIKII